MNKLRLVTVTGSRTTTLYHMLKHYAHLVDEMCVVVYEWEGSSTYDEVSKIVNQFGNAKIVYREIAEKFNWEKVTELYNKIKSEHPNDWWIISDDDEFHAYSKPLYETTKSFVPCICSTGTSLTGSQLSKVSGVIDPVTEAIAANVSLI